MRISHNALDRVWLLRFHNELLNTALRLCLPVHPSETQGHRTFLQMSLEVNHQGQYTENLQRIDCRWSTPTWPNKFKKLHLTDSHLTDFSVYQIQQKSVRCIYLRASIIYDILVWFSWDFYETILVGKFQSRDIGENRTSRHSLIITQLHIYIQLTATLPAAVVT